MDLWIIHNAFWSIIPIRGANKTNRARHTALTCRLTLCPQQSTPSRRRLLSSYGGMALLATVLKRPGHLWCRALHDWRIIKKKKKEGKKKKPDSKVDWQRDWCKTWQPACPCSGMTLGRSRFNDWFSEIALSLERSAIKDISSSTNLGWICREWLVSEYQFKAAKDH